MIRLGSGGARCGIFAKRWHAYLVLLLAAGSALWWGSLIAWLLGIV
jgi:hypothetical protein